jgi:hypothetical protein
MTQRERTMATILGGGVVFGVGFFGFLMFYNAFVASGAAIEKLEKDIADAKNEIDFVKRDSAKLQRWRRLSFTGDLDQTRGAFKEYLIEKLRRHSLTNSFNFDAAPADARSLIIHPTKQGKLPIYTGINFFVRFKAKMPNLVSFIQDFQSEPKLQRIKAMTVERADDKKDDWLTVQMTFEALTILDADKSVKPAMFMPTQPVLKWDTKAFLAGAPNGIAMLGWSITPFSIRLDPLNPPLTSTRRYNDIARQNPFVGTVEVKPIIGSGFGDAPPKDELINVMRFSRLVSLIDEQGNSEAWLWNPANNKWYRMRTKPGYDTFPLVQTEKERAVVYGKLVKIQDNDIVFRVALKPAFPGSTRWWRYPEGNNFYRLHPEDQDKLLQDESIAESDRNDVYLVPVPFWEKLTRKDKGKIDVSKDGKSFRVLGDAAFGTIVFSDAKVVIIRMNGWPPGNAPVAPSVAASRLYPEADAIYYVESKHFKELQASKKVKEGEIDRICVMRTEHYNHLRQQRIIRSTTGGGGGMGGGGGGGNSFAFYTDLIKCDIISEGNDMVVFRLAEKYCRCPGDRDTGVEDRWHEGFCVLRLHGFAQDALQAPLSPSKVKELLNPTPP